MVKLLNMLHNVVVDVTIVLFLLPESFLYVQIIGPRGCQLPDEFTLPKLSLANKFIYPSGANLY